MKSEEQGSEKKKVHVRIRPMTEEDVPAADRIYRLAFGTFFGIPDPTKFAGDATIIKTRWKAEPEVAFGAEVDDTLVGSNFVSHWGTVGGFGPVTTHPDFWDQGIASKLLEPMEALYKKWDTQHMGIFTHANSAKHIGLYQKYGFWARFLTAIMTLKVQEKSLPVMTLLSEVPGNNKDEHYEACRAVTDAIYAGLDVSREIRSVDNQNLGDTILLYNDSKLASFAVVHCGPGTEAGSGTCYIKFAAVRPGPSSDWRFEQLLDACEAYAFSQGLARLTGGVNMGCHEAYRIMLGRGFHTFIQGVAMQRPNESGFFREDVYIINDWR